MARLAPLRTPSSIRASSSAPIAPRGAPDPARRGVAVHSSSAADPNAAQSRDAPWSPCLALLRVCLYQNPTLNPPRYSTPGRDSHREPCLPFAEPFFGLAFFLLPLADLALFMAFPTALRVSVLTTAFTTTFPIPPMWLPIPTFSRDSCAKGKAGRTRTRLSVPSAGAYPRGLAACFRDLDARCRPLPLSPRALRLPRPSRCPLPSKPSCAFSPLGSSSRVFTTSRDYVEASVGTARPITQAVGKVQGGSCGQKG